MTWTTDVPKEPGWYWLRYTGYKSRQVHKLPIQLAYPETGGMLVADKLAMREESRGEYHFREIRFPTDCEPVEWAGPIPEPEDA